MPESRAQFSVGQVVVHRLFGYRGVVFDVDANFSLSEHWYREMARSQPPRNRPWYHVLVHDAAHTTYVAERNLQVDESGEPIRHPLLGRYFGSFGDGRYERARRPN